MRSLKILAVDDDPVFLALVEQCLMGAGHAVDTFRNGAAGLEALQSDYDAAIIDLVMPKIDGFRMIAMIRATPRLKDLPIMVMSSRLDEMAVEEAYRLGANGYETKPVNWSLFPLHLEHVVEVCEKMAALKAAAGAPVATSIV